MVNQIKLREALKSYKESFHERWNGEKYKWEAIKCFQDNWDVEAVNFYGMFTRATEKTGNLLVSANNFPRRMIQHFSEKEPETVRGMFFELFDESREVSERILKFQSDAEGLCEKYYPGKQHFQRSMAITVYLWLKYPERHNIYKYTICRQTCLYLESNLVPIKGHTAENLEISKRLGEEILTAVKSDTELIAMFNEAVDDNCYPDTSYKTLAFDVSFYIANYLYEQKHSVTEKTGDMIADEKDDTDEKQIQEFKEYDKLKSNARFVKWLYPVILALRELGGSGQVSEVHDKIIELYNVTEEELAEVNNSGTSVIINDIDWARNYLNYEGFLDKEAPRGIWTLSPLGEKIVISDSLAGMIVAKWIRITAVKRNGEAIPNINLEQFYHYISEPKLLLKPYTREKFLSEVYMAEEEYDILKKLLLNKKNVILQGAPGVGKTFTAKRLAYSILEKEDESHIEFIQFHQNYSYEDFIMGYRPDGEGFSLQYGIFYRFCIKATANPEEPYFFIIDEINRGNMSKIFGELLMLIEKDYRGVKSTLAYSGTVFSVPDNLYIIGMMNTADRSLAMIDYALRRRFSFYTMEPGFSSKGFVNYLTDLDNETLNLLVEKLKDLNDEITMDSSLGGGFCIGHSYLCNQKECTEEWMQSVVEYDIIPMLEEYWFDDNQKLQKWKSILRGVFND